VRAVRGDAGIACHGVLVRLLSLFSGIGAHDLGLERAGLTIAGQVEIDPYCAAVLEKHWPDVPRWSDVRTVTADDVLARCGRIDLVTGGVPCQPASVAGKRQGAADSRWLWPEYLRLVVDLRPQWLLAENVPGFLSLGESEQVFLDLEAAGYEVWPLVVGAWAVGAPHKRDRAWIVGRRMDESNLPGCGVAGEGDAGRGERSKGQPDHRAAGGAGAELADVRGQGLPQSEFETLRGARWQNERRATPELPPTLEHAISTGLRTGRERGTRRPNERCPSLRWPARPGEDQHEWEAPRLAHPHRREPRGASSPRLQSGAALANDTGEGPTQSGVGSSTPGPSRRLAGFARRNALKALGNANPPWVPFLIGRWMMQQIDTRKHEA